MATTLPYRGNTPASPSPAGQNPTTSTPPQSGFQSAVNTLNGFGNTLQTGFNAFLNPINQFTSGINSIATTARNVMDLGQSAVSGFKSIFGLDGADKQAAANAAAQQQQQIADERNQMMGEEVSDQQRRARAQQYSQTNAYGNVHWEYGPDGTPHQVSTLDSHQQAMKDAAGNLIGQVGSQDSVNQAVNQITQSQMDMYHRQNDERNSEQIRATQETLRRQGISPDSPAYRAAMKNVYDAQAMAQANAADQATAQGYQYGNQTYQNYLAGFNALNSFKDPLEQYKEMAGAGAYSQSAVQPAWQYGGQREDARTQAAYQQQQLAENTRQFNATQAQDMAKLNMEQRFKHDESQEEYKHMDQRDIDLYNMELDKLATQNTWKEGSEDKMYEKNEEQAENASLRAEWQNQAAHGRSIDLEQMRNDNQEESDYRKARIDNRNARSAEEFRAKNAENIEKMRNENAMAQLQLKTDSELQMEADRNLTALKQTQATLANQRLTTDQEHELKMLENRQKQEVYNSTSEKLRRGIRVGSEVFDLFGKGMSTFSKGAVQGFTQGVFGMKDLFSGQGMADAQQDADYARENKKQEQITQARNRNEEIEKQRTREVERQIEIKSNVRKALAEGNAPDPTVFGPGGLLEGKVPVYTGSNDPKEKQDPKNWAWTDSKTAGGWSPDRGHWDSQQQKFSNGWEPTEEEKKLMNLPPPKPGFWSKFNPFS